MKIIACFSILALLLASCGGSNSASETTFCDTTCRTEPITFTGDHPLQPTVSISFRNCVADTLTWNHAELPATRQVQLGGFFQESVRLSPKAVSCYFKDTSYVWISYNDCETGRGYLARLPFSRAGSIKKANTALNSFDRKFSLTDDMRAYASESTIYVVNVNTNEEASISLDGNLIDFNNIHATLDSINVTPQRIYVRMMKKGGEAVELQKQISL